MVTNKAICLLLFIEPLSLCLFSLLSLLPFYFCDLVFVIMFIMVPLPRQCPGVAGKVCNHFLPAKENDPHRLCTASLGKTCDIEDCCEDCHDWPDEKCHCLGEYSILLSCQPSVRERLRPLPLPFQGTPPQCLSPCITYHPKCVQV